MIWTEKNSLHNTEFRAWDSGCYGSHHQIYFAPKFLPVRTDCRVERAVLHMYDRYMEGEVRLCPLCNGERRETIYRYTTTFAGEQEIYSCFCGMIYASETAAGLYKSLAVRKYRRNRFGRRR